VLDYETTTRKPKTNPISYFLGQLQTGLVIISMPEAHEAVNTVFVSIVNTSSESFLQNGDDAKRILCAVAVLPVKLMTLVAGWLVSACPALAPLPNTMFTTPAGTPTVRRQTRLVLVFVLLLKVISLHQEFVCVRLTDKSFYVAGPRAWNSLHVHSAYCHQDS